MAQLEFSPAMNSITLLELVNRPPAPKPWDEGDNIPWFDPAFSARMLKEHLSQAHDLASRRQALITQHVTWIHTTLLGASPARILDLGCGPGQYTSRFAQLGHICVGIDYSPASIAYARAQAEREKLACTYVQEDLRRAEFDAGYGLAMLIFGEFNVFRPADAALILDKIRRALVPGGVLILEAHTFEAIQKIGQSERSWYSSLGGLFSPRPHLCLQEHVWEPSAQTSTTRYYVVDAETGGAFAYAHTFQAYTDTQYRALLAEHGFGELQVYRAFGEDTGIASQGLTVLVARAQP